ncbi:MAG: hypothetical protein J1G01_00260 [Clostridiales bacterium]|nr:hypothetical protein [Clostridiales bacterium]
MAIWIFTLIAIAAAFIAFAGFVLPKILFYTRFEIDGTADRGIKKIDEDDRFGIVCEPPLEARKYIKEYALTRSDDKSVLVCKLGSELNYIDYDILVFDEKDKPQRVFNVKENVTGKEYTRVVELPSGTAYVSLFVNEADGQKFRHSFEKHASTGRVAAFIALSAVLIALAVIGIKVCFAYLFAGIFRESFIVLGKSTAVTAIIFAAVTLVDIILTVTAFLLRRSASKGGKL